MELRAFETTVGATRTRTHESTRMRVFMDDRRRLNVSLEIQWGSHLSAVPLGAGPLSSAVKISSHDLSHLSAVAALKWDRSRTKAGPSRLHISTYLAQNSSSRSTSTQHSRCPPVAVAPPHESSMSWASVCRRQPVSYTHLTLPTIYSV